jgi:hypothetical protein
MPGFRDLTSLSVILSGAVLCTLSGGAVLAQSAASCGDESTGHCYAVSTTQSTPKFGHANITVVRLSLGSMLFVDDEAWLTDDQSARCKASACWVEAGYYAQASQFAGAGFNYFVAWCDGVTFQVVPLGEVAQKDIGGNLSVTLTSNPTTHTATVIVRSPQGSVIYQKPLPVQMTPTKFTFGQELAGSGTGSASQAIFSNLRISGSPAGPGSPIQTHSDRSDKPPYGAWLKTPAQAQGQATFATHCC